MKTDTIAAIATGMNPSGISIIRVSGDDAVSVVDGISSVGVMELKKDDWGIDILVSASQKGLMLPPGLSFLSVSEKAWDLYEKCLYHSEYFDWKRYKYAYEHTTVPYTPAVNLVCALDNILKYIKQIGLESLINERENLMKILRAGLKDLGLKLLTEDDKKSSSAVVAVYPPKGILASDVIQTMKKNYNIIIAGGQGDLAGKIFRIGALGDISENEISFTLDALAATIKSLS